MIGFREKPRAPKPRTWTRKTYAAELVRGAEPAPYLAGTLHLELRRGCWTRTVDKAGEVIADDRDPSALLWANVGDRLLVFGAGDDDVTGDSMLCATCRAKYADDDDAEAGG